MGMFNADNTVAFTFFFVAPKSMIEMIFSDAYIFLGIHCTSAQDYLTINVDQGH